VIARFVISIVSLARIGTRSFVSHGWSFILPIKIGKEPLDNHTWVPPPEDKYNENRDPIIKGLTWVDDSGKEINFVGQFVYCLLKRERPRWISNYELASKSIRHYK
jgi:hypothetical protein